jgi:hypothetical protein
MTASEIVTLIVTVLMIAVPAIWYTSKQIKGEK